MAKKDKTAFSILLGKKIREARLSKNLTQEKLAETAGLHTSYVGQIERGEKSPSLDTLMDIAKALNLSVAYLINTPEYSMQKELSDLILLCSKASKEDICLITEMAKLILNKSRLQ